MPPLCTETREQGADSTVERRDTLAVRLRTAAAQLVCDIVFLLCLFTHPDTPWYARCVLCLPVMYLCSPIQLIPNFIPVIGQMDDVLLIWISKKFARKLVDRETRQKCQDAAAQTTLAFSRRISGVTSRQLNFNQKPL